MARRTRTTRTIRRGEETFTAVLTFYEDSARTELTPFDDVTVEIEEHASVEVTGDGELTVTASLDDTAEWSVPTHRLSIYASLDDERVEVLILEVPTK
jgi:hypothetical protein